MMFTIDEVKTRINQSNISAFSQQGAQESYPRGMARLITEFHLFCEAANADVDGIWKSRELPGRNEFDENHLNLFRGAFARTQVGLDPGPGPYGRTSINNLFGSEALMASINQLFLLSSENPVHLLNIEWENNEIFNHCEGFWNQCAGAAVSSIYRSKTLSMLFPDLFVPFDSNSIDKLREDNDAGNLIRPIDWPRDRNIHWRQYLDAHKYFQELCRRLIEQVADAEDDPVRYLRELSCYSENDTYQDKFDRIANEITDSPPPITRFIDKIFYMPGQRENANPPPAREATPDLELANEMQHVVYPLSGRGESIGYNETDEGLNIRYSGQDTHLSWEEVEDILDEFFVDFDKWYLSGASRTDPPAGSFGAFLNERDGALHSSKVTPIAAVLVHQERLEARGLRPIELKRRSDN